MANHMVELWSRFQRGEIVNPNDFMEEMSKVNLKLDRQYGAESREEEDLHGLTSKPASEESSSGKLERSEHLLEPPLDSAFQPLQSRASTSATPPN